MWLKLGYKNLLFILQAGEKTSWKIVLDLHNNLDVNISLWHRHAIETLEWISNAVLFLSTNHTHPRTLGSMQQCCSMINVYVTAQKILGWKFFS